MRYLFLIGEVSYGELIRNNLVVRLEWIIKVFNKELMLISSSFFFFGGYNKIEKGLEFLKVKNVFFYSVLSYEFLENFLVDFVIDIIIVENFVMENNGLWGFCMCKLGFGDRINCGFMSYKFRKKGVCDFSDNFYY